MLLSRSIFSGQTSVVRSQINPIPSDVRMTALTMHRSKPFIAASTPPHPHCWDCRDLLPRGRVWHAVLPNSACYNVSERISPRSRRQTYFYACTSGQTWLTAARPETHQNLIHTSNDRGPRGTAQTRRANPSTERPTASTPTLWRANTAPNRNFAVVVSDAKRCQPSQSKPAQTIIRGANRPPDF